MANPRQEYLEFLALVNPAGTDLRTALWGHFFPDNVNTRNPITFEYKVIFCVLSCNNLILDLSTSARFAFAFFR